MKFNVELCAEDRARLDTIIELLQVNRTPVTKAPEPLPLEKLAAVKAEVKSTMPEPVVGKDALYKAVEPYLSEIKRFGGTKTSQEICDKLRSLGYKASGQTYTDIFNRYATEHGYKPINRNGDKHYQAAVPVILKHSKHYNGLLADADIAAMLGVTQSTVTHYRQRMRDEANEKR